MNGVEILDTVKVVTEYTPIWGWFWGIVLTTFIGSGIGFFCLVQHEEPFDFKENVIFSVVMGLVLSCAMGFLSSAVFKKPTAYETQYKITISDEVNFNEFNDKYEILDQEGKIYTVKEKE